MPAIRYAIRFSWRERRTCLGCLSQGLRLSPRSTRPSDAHLFAQARTLRIIQFSGLTCSTGLIDLAARAGAILAIARRIFIRFRELTSARRNALLQLLCPVEDDVDALLSGVRFDPAGPCDDQQPAALGPDVIAKNLQDLPLAVW